MPSCNLHYLRTFRRISNIQLTERVSRTILATWHSYSWTTSNVLIFIDVILVQSDRRRRSPRLLRTNCGCECFLNLVIILGSNTSTLCKIPCLNTVRPRIGSQFQAAKAVLVESRVAITTRTYNTIDRCLVITEHHITLCLVTETRRAFCRLYPYLSGTLIGTSLLAWRITVKEFEF